MAVREILPIILVQVVTALMWTATAVTDRYVIENYM